MGVSGGGLGYIDEEGSTDEDEFQAIEDPKEKQAFVLNALLQEMERRDKPSLIAAMRETAAALGVTMKPQKPGDFLQRSADLFRQADFTALQDLFEQAHTAGMNPNWGHFSDDRELTTALISSIEKGNTEEFHAFTEAQGYVIDVKKETYLLETALYKGNMLPQRVLAVARYAKAKGLGQDYTIPQEKATAVQQTGKSNMLGKLMTFVKGLSGTHEPKSTAAQAPKTEFRLGLIRPEYKEHIRYHLLNSLTAKILDGGKADVDVILEAMELLDMEIDQARIISNAFAHSTSSHHLENIMIIIAKHDWQIPKNNWEELVMQACTSRNMGSSTWIESVRQYTTGKGLDIDFTPAIMQRILRTVNGKYGIDVGLQNAQLFIDALGGKKLTVELSENPIKDQLIEKYCKVILERASAGYCLAQLRQIGVEVSEGELRIKAFQFIANGEPSRLHIGEECELLLAALELGEVLPQDPAIQIYLEDRMAGELINNTFEIPEEEYCEPVIALAKLYAIQMDDAFALCQKSFERKVANPVNSGSSVLAYQYKALQREKPDYDVKPLVMSNIDTFTRSGNIDAARNLFHFLADIAQQQESGEDEEAAA